MIHFNLVDLTHTITDSIPTWTGSCGFSHENKVDYDQGVRAQTFRMHAGVGTHMDAPTHFIPEGKNIGDLPIEDFIIPCCVIDVSKRRAPDLFIQPDDILSFEKENGEIPPRCLIFGYTGWQHFWNDPQKYRNPDPAGKMHFPGFSKECAELLIERGVVGIGIDTLSPDGSNTDHFPVHEIMLGKGKYIIENLTNLEKIPPVGSLAIVMPLKIAEGTESAIRAVGLVLN